MPRSNIERADAEPAETTRDPAARLDRDRAPGLQPDPPAVEENWRVGLARPRTGRWYSTQREQALILKEEIPLLGKEQG